MRACLPGLEELILRHAAGEDDGAIAMPTRRGRSDDDPHPARRNLRGCRGACERARSEAGIEDVIVTAKQGQKLIPLPEGASYLGFIFARGETPDAVEQALRTSHRAIAL